MSHVYLTFLLALLGLKFVQVLTFYYCITTRNEVKYKEKIDQLNKIIYGNVVE